MPNVETENKNNVPRKNKNKSLAVTTEKDVSSQSQETFSPMTPAIESGDSSLENVNKNPYIDVVIKRLRKLKKVMRNVEKYEALQNSSDPEVELKDEQIKVLERKGETSGAIKEFEGTLKQIESVEKDELKKQAELKKAQQVERDQAIADAVEKVKATHCKSLLQLILFFRLIHFQQRGIVQLPDNEFEAVETLRAKLTTLSEEAENDESYEEKIRQVLDLVEKLNSSDEGLILPNGVPETDQAASSGEAPSYGISCSQLRTLIKNPPILETTGDQEELNETFEIINTPDNVDANNDYNTGLQFMRPDDQSQPQAFDNTINNTTFGYQSTDVEQTSVEETIVEVNVGNVQEQFSQQQNYDTYTVEQQQHFTVEQQQQYIGEQQQQIEQEDQQVSTEQEELPQQQEEPPVQESQTTSEDQTDSNLQQATPQQNSSQPPPLSQGSGHRGGRYRGNRGHRGQGSRRDSGGYNNYGGGYYRDGNYGNYRGRGGQGPRGGRGGGFHQGNRGTPYKQRSQ